VRPHGTCRFRMVSASPITSRPMFAALLRSSRRHAAVKITFSRFYPAGTLNRHFRSSSSGEKRQIAAPPITPFFGAFSASIGVAARSQVKIIPATLQAFILSCASSGVATERAVTNVSIVSATLSSQICFALPVRQVSSKRVSRDVHRDAAIAETWAIFRVNRRCQVRRAIPEPRNCTGPHALMPLVLSAIRRIGITHQAILVSAARRVWGSALKAATPLVAARQINQINADARPRCPADITLKIELW